MDVPISFTQYFVNKQNVRSFSNIIKQVLFKPENEKEFLKHIIFNDGDLFQELSPEFRNILVELRENIKYISKHDFRHYFQENDSSNLSPMDKTYININCSNVLRNIIPKTFFGSNHNHKVFNKITTNIIYSFKRQYFNYEVLTEQWDFSKTPWTTLPAGILKKTLICMLFWVHRYILCSIISLNFYVTSCNNDNELHYISKSAWQSFYDKSVAKMLLCNTIKKVSGCRNKNYKNIKSPKHQFSKKDTPKLVLILKSKSNDYRPIVIYKKDVHRLDKKQIKEKLNFLRVISGVTYEKIESQYLVLYKKWVSQNKPELYFIKTDLTNAFGLIDKKILLKILCERHQKLQSLEKSLLLKKKYATLYRQFVNELRSPFVIRTGSSFYEWNKGLVQGYKYSPALSELYYSYMDEMFFTKFIQKSENKIKLFIRVVDDYLYITECLEDAHSFLNALNNYKNVNYNKTVVNFPYKNIRQSSHITFLGYTYDTEKLNICRAKNVFVGQMCYKIAFTPAISNLAKFIENRIGQCGIFISGHIFNFYYNYEALVWQHIFVTLCHSANKFCTILAILCQESDMPKYLPIYHRKVSNSLCSSIIGTLKKNKPADFKFVYCINHFKYLSYRALLLCVKETSKCSKLISYVEVCLSKTNCIFGKWSQHYSRITVDRNILAIREQCRRHDLKVILKDFNTLPEGFECFKSIKSI